MGSRGEAAARPPDSTCTRTRKRTQAGPGARNPRPAPPLPRAPQVREGRGPRAGASRRRRRRPGRGDPGAPEEAPRPSPGPSGPPKLAPRFPELQERPGPKEGAGGTHRDHDRVFSLKLGDVLIAAVHLGLVQRSEATHHFDVAFGRVRHLPGCRGRRPGATPRRSVLEETGRAEGLGSRRPRARGPRRRASPAGAAGTGAAAPAPAPSPAGSLPTHHGSHGGAGRRRLLSFSFAGGARCGAGGSRRPGTRPPLSSSERAGRAQRRPALLSARRFARYRLLIPDSADGRRAVGGAARGGRSIAHARRARRPGDQSAPAPPLRAGVAGPSFPTSTRRGTCGSRRRIRRSWLKR